MTPREVLDHGRRISPSELITFARSHEIAHMDTDQRYALILALATKLDWACDQIYPLDGMSACNACQAEQDTADYPIAEAAEIHEKIDTFLANAELAERAADWNQVP